MIKIAIVLLFFDQTSSAFSQVVSFVRRPSSTRVWSDWKGNDQDSNQWQSSDDKTPRRVADAGTDWQDMLSRKQDGEFWSSFEPSEEGSEIVEGEGNTTSFLNDEEKEAELWLDTVQALSADEVEFNLLEADRADKARQMEEWGFGRDTIANALGVATDNSIENAEEIEGMQLYREEAFLDEIDLETVESHTTVDVEEETGDPTRSQMVYVDEHSCIGCTNCAMIAQSTFFMHSEHGRARVFQQWGDDDETIQVAIETCPVDCIHYVPFEELVALEKDRRGQNINFKARLVSQAENGNSLSHLTGGGPNAFTAPQTISGNMLSRCSNCPSRGCRDCPMYGVGKNPEFEKREQVRKERIAKKKLLQQRERDQKSAEL